MKLQRWYRYHPVPETKRCSICRELRNDGWRLGLPLPLYFICLYCCPCRPVPLEDEG
jgi:hypothetical protein